jgi:ACR3 family arsenite efflux pump ArsB
MERSSFWAEVREPAILLGAAVVGTFLSVRWSEAAPFAERAIVPLLVVVLFTLFIRIPFGRLREAMRDWSYVLAVLALNFGSTPVLASVLGGIFLSDVPELRVGLFLAVLTPCTDWYVIFTHLVRGDVARNLAVLPWNAILQVVLLPVYLWLFMSAWLSVDMVEIGRSVLLFVGLPGIAAQVVRRRWGERVAWDRLGLAALGLVVVAMFASHGYLVREHPLLFLRLALPLLVFYAVALALSWGVARLLRFPRERFLALACTTMARNSPLMLPLAIVLFPGHPIIALSQVIEPMVEIPSLILFSAVVRWRAARAGMGRA